MESRRARAGAALACVAIGALSWLALAAAARGDAPLTAADVVRFLRAGISERTILLELDGRGFGEPFDEDRETALRDAGASRILLAAVCAAAASVPPTVSAAELPRVVPVDPHAPTFTASTRTVRVPVSVLDKAGQPVLDLQAASFHVADNGQKQAVSLFSHERRPLRIALALDISTSMQNKIGQVDEALMHFVSLLEPADQILVIAFNHEVRVVQDFTADREALGRVLDALEPLGNTVLYDAAYEAIRKVKDGTAESKAVVLVTDGVDTGSKIAFADLRELARRAEVPVFSIGLDGGVVLEDTGGRPHPPGGGRPPGGGHGGHGGPGRGSGGGGWGGGPPGGGWGGGPGGGPGGPGGGPPGGGRSSRSHPSRFNAKPLVDLADDTGGTAQVVKFEHYTPGSDELPGAEPLRAAVESIATILRYRYLVGYEPPAATAREWRTLAVEVDRAGCTARTRKGYYTGE
jgi:VWFA-related protein